MSARRYVLRLCLRDRDAALPPLLRCVCPFAYAVIHLAPIPFSVSHVAVRCIL